MATPDDTDGCFGQGWGGTAPEGSHVNVLLARRGSPTAAAVTTAFTAPSPGYTPILACVGADQPSYQTVYPPTIIVNKMPATDEHLEALVSGAGQLGIAQGVLDAVAENLLVADQNTLVLVSLWLDTRATDETAVRHACRRATATAVREAITGRDPADVRRLVSNRDVHTHPFYGGT